MFIKAPLSFGLLRDILIGSTLLHSLLLEIQLSLCLMKHNQSVGCSERQPLQLGLLGISWSTLLVIFS